MQSLRNQVKTPPIVPLKNQYKPSAMPMRLQLARSSYSYHAARITLADKYLLARRTLAEIFVSNDRRLIVFAASGPL